MRIYVYDIVHTHVTCASGYNLHLVFYGIYMSMDSTFGLAWLTVMVVHGTMNLLQGKKTELTKLDG